MAKQLLSVIVINYGTPELVLNFLNSIRNSSDSVLVREVIIVDNGYPDKGDSRKFIINSSFPFKVKFAQNPDTSYTSGVNRGVALASTDTIIIANSDVELIPQFSLKPLAKKLWQDSHIGITGPQLVYPDGRWQRSYGRFPSVWEAFISLTMLDSLWRGIIMWAFHCNCLLKCPKAVEYIDGAFMVVRRSCFEKLSGFDESYYFYGEDADFCWRAWRNNQKVVFVPSTRVMHIRGAFSTKNILEDYIIQLFHARQKFIEDHFGRRPSIWDN